MIKVRDRVLPIVFVALSVIWMAAIICPVLYSVLFPSRDIQAVVWALEGRGEPPKDLASLVRQVGDAAGRLQRAVQVGAYWGVTEQYGAKKSGTSREAQVSYLAWFQKRSKPTILIVTPTKVALNP